MLSAFYKSISCLGAYTMALMKVISTLLGGIVLTACSHNPSSGNIFEDLPVDMSNRLPTENQQWQLTDNTLEYSAENSDWWLSFESPQLNTLINKALQSNPDLLMARQRILQAEAQLGITRASALPHLDATASFGLTQTDDAGGSSNNRMRKSSSLGVSTRYEIDLWGRIAAEKLASESILDSKVYDWYATRLTLTSAVANSWFEWLVLGEQLNNARWYLQAAEKQLHFMQLAYQSGSATRIELARQRKQVLERSTQLKTLNHQWRLASNALAILLGEVPQQFEPPYVQLMQLNIPRPNPGLPIEILSRRPDLAREEAILSAAHANVAAVRAAIYPSVSLQASARLVSDGLNFIDPINTLSLGADIVQSLFDFGERSRRIELTQAKKVEMLLSYYQAVLKALAEVEDALSDEQLTRELEIQQQALMKENNLISKNTEYLYNAGAETLVNLLNVQQEELQAKDALLERYQQRLNASINLYKVLGGGWTINSDGL